MLHGVDCYTCECLPFFLRQKSFQRWIRFYKRAETLRVVCQNNLGKPSGRKTPTGPVEYLGHASTESQAEEEMFEGNFFLTVYLSLVFQRSTTMQPGRQWMFAMSFNFFVASNANCSLSLFTSFPAGVAAQHEGVKPSNCHRLIVTQKRKFLCKPRVVFELWKVKALLHTFQAKDQRLDQPASTLSHQGVSSEEGCIEQLQVFSLPKRHRRHSHHPSFCSPSPSGEHRKALHSEKSTEWRRQGATDVKGVSTKFQRKPQTV